MEAVVFKDGLKPAANPANIETSRDPQPRSSPQIIPVDTLSSLASESDAKKSPRATSGSSTAPSIANEDNFLALTPEDVPRCYDLYAINRITHHLNWFREEEQKLYVLLAVIDGQMRETITLNWGIANCTLEVVDRLLSLPEEKRDFDQAYAHLKSKLDELKDEEVKLYKNLLGARTHIFIKGQEVKINPERKKELLQQFESQVGNKFSEGLKGFTKESIRDLTQLKKQLEAKVDDMLVLKDDMLESKVVLQMQAEDIKGLPEFKALIAARKKIRAQYLATDLWEAAESCNQDALKTALQEVSVFAVFLSPEKRFVNSVNSLGYSALHLAAYKGDSACVKLLLDAGASMHIRDRNGYQPMHWAAKLGHLSVCKLFTEKDLAVVDVPAYIVDDAGNNYGSRRDSKRNEFGGYGRTPLHRAAYNGHHEVVTFFLEKGADPNRRTTAENGSVTCLMEAIQQEKNRVVSELLKSKKIDVEIMDGRQHSALWWAVTLGKAEYIALIIGHQTYKRYKKPTDPNHIDNLLKITPANNGAEIKEMLENLKAATTPSK